MYQRPDALFVIFDGTDEDKPTDVFVLRCRMSELPPIPRDGESIDCREHGHLTVESTSLSYSSNPVDGRTWLEVNVWCIRPTRQLEEPPPERQPPPKKEWNPYEDIRVDLRKVPINIRRLYQPEYHAHRPPSKGDPPKKPDKADPRWFRDGVIKDH